MRRVIAAAVVALSAWQVAAQTQTTVRVPAPTIDVLVDVGGRREPLQASDFVVTADTMPVSVTGVRRVAPSGGPALAPILSDSDELARSAEADRIVAIYLDEYHLRAGASFDEARARLASFVRDALGPRDLVVVTRPLDTAGVVRLTTDRAGTATTIAQSRARAADYTPTSDFERQFIAGAPERIDEARRQLTWAGLDTLVAHVGRMPAGRKTVLVLSDGLVERGTRRRDGPTSGPDSIARAANRARVAVYALRPSTVAPVSTGDDSAQVRDEAMDVVARLTTGATFDGMAAIDAGLGRVLDESGRYYLLTLGADLALPTDGRLRALAVTPSARGVTIRARSGVARAYERPPDVFAPSPVAAALAIPRHASPLIQLWVGQTPSRDGRTRVDLVWEPAPRVPGAPVPSGRPARVAVSARRLGGGEVFVGTIAATGAVRVVPTLGQASATFEAPPGPLLLQMDVLDGAGHVLDRDVRDVAVAAMPTDVGVNTPAVYRARTAPELRAVLVDEAGAGTSPVASRRFTRTDHLVVRFAALSPQTLTPDVAVRLMRFGTQVRELPLRAISAPTHRWQVDLPLAPLPAGHYTFEFEARTTTRTSLDRLEFDLVP